MKANLYAFDDRYARGGLNILMAPIYGLSIAADYIVSNSIQFRFGESFIHHKPHIFDMKTENLFKINDDLNPSLNKAVDVSKTEKQILSTQMVSVNATTFDMNIVYTNGDTAVLRGEKNGDAVTYYMNGEVIITTSIAELKAFKA